MPLTPEQLAVIRESTINEEAYQRVVDLFDDTPPPPMPKVDYLFGLSPQQAKEVLAVMDAIPIAISLKNRQGLYVMGNQAVVDMIGIKRHRDLISKTDFDLMAHELAQEEFDQEQHIMETGIPILNQEVHIERDGQPHYYLMIKSPIYNEDGEIIGLITIHRDISDQKQVEQSLENERNLLRTIIDHIHDKIYVKDRESRFVTANAETVRVMLASYGVTLDNLIGSTDFDYMPYERSKQLFDEEQTIMQTGEPIINQELMTPSVTKHRDLWFLVSKVPIYDDEGNVIGLVGINRDITSRKLASQHAVQIEVEQEKSKFLTEFITESSHEFRTPISIIRTSSYLLTHSADPAKHEHYIAQITEQTERLEALINNLNLMITLDYQEHINRQSIHLRQYLHNLIEYCAKYLKHRDITIEVVDEGMDAPYYGNDPLLTIALSQVVHNAIRYSHDDGIIKLIGKSTPQEVSIQIVDYGIGISEQTLPNVFKRFFREDYSRSTYGFGLGLPIAQRIIELHGGTIAIESQLDVGTTVHVQLPQVDSI